MSNVQQGIVLQLGPDADNLTDYSCDFAEFTIRPNRQTVQKAGTFGSPNLEQKGSTLSFEVGVSCLLVPNTATGLWFELWQAMNTPTGELYFDVLYDDTTVGSSNPRYTGYVVITSLQTGAGIAQARRLVTTWPARAVSDPLAA